MYTYTYTYTYIFYSVLLTVGGFCLPPCSVAWPLPSVRYGHSLQSVLRARHHVGDTFRHFIIFQFFRQSAENSLCLRARYLVLLLKTNT